MHSILYYTPKDNKDRNKINTSNEKGISNLKIEHISSFQVKSKLKNINLVYKKYLKQLKADKNIIKQEKKVESITNYKNIKSEYIFKNILEFLGERKLLKIIKYNKNIQKILNIREKYYKEFCQIEIEVIPSKYEEGKFINIFNKEEKPYFHIYFNDNNKEVKRNYLTKNDKINKIKIIIDYQVKSITELFDKCKCIKSINFKKFNRNDFKSFFSIFHDCSLLKEINMSRVNTDNIEDMSFLFY